MVMYQIGRLTSHPNRFSHLANAVKYSTSIFPLLVSAYQKTVSAATSSNLEPLLILLLVINALYALYWDVVMDWGLLQNPTAVCKSIHYSSLASSSSALSSHHGSSNLCHSLMRPRLRFGIVMSALIVMADSILRFSWTLRFYHALFPSPNSFVLCTQFLEVFRRALWNLLRMEWEHLKQTSQQTELAKKRGDDFDEFDESSTTTGIVMIHPVSNNNNSPNLPSSSSSSLGPINGTMGITSGHAGGSTHGGSTSASSVVSSAAELTSFILNTTTKRAKEATA